MTVLLAIAAAMLLIQAPAPASQSLSAHLPVRVTLAGGERALYTLDVPANYAARVTIRQEGLDVNVRMVRHGEPMVGSQFYNYTGGDSGEERAYPLVLDRATTWDLRLSPVLPKAPRADVVIEVDMAPADDRDRAIAAARWTFFEAIVALETPDANGLRAAREKYTAAAAAARENGDLPLEAEATFQNGRMFDQLGDQPGALEWQGRALALFRRLDQKDRVSRVLNRLGDVSRKVGAVTEAEAYFREALPLAREVNDLNNIADTLNNSGLLLLATGRAEEAIAQLEAALPLAREINSANVELALLNNSAQAYKDLGMFDKAIEVSTSSLPVSERLNVPRRTARTLSGIAENYFAAGDTAKADDTIKRSLAVYETAGDRVGYADALGLQARMWAAAGDTDRALAAFAVARPLLQQAQNRPGEATLLASWADVDIHRGEYDAALSKLDTAIALSRVTVDRDTETRALYLQAVALRQQQRLDAAVAAITRVIDNVESTRGSIARTDLRTSYLAAVHAYYDFYVDLLQQRGDAAGAFAVSERARARSLLEGLAESAAKIEKGVDPQLLARQRAVQRDLNAKEAYRAALVARDGEQHPAARTAAADIARLVEQLDAVRAQIRKASPEYAALQLPQPITAATLQQLLDETTALVAYHLGAEHSYAWVIDRGSITAHALPPMAEIEGLARRYHETLSTEIDALAAPEKIKVDASVKALGRQLAAAVWKPIEARVKDRRLLVVADGALSYVPFMALPTSAGGPVLAAHEVVSLPSASVLATLRNSSRRVTLGPATAVFADPVFSRNDPRLAAARVAGDGGGSRAAGGADYARLRFSRREAEAISERAPGAFQALDFAAAKSALTSRNLRQYRVLHFATHGILNTEHPELSGLVFSLFDKSGKTVDGFLRLHEIYNLDLDADLVVLSACRTALGREVHGEGLIGLTRGFMYAGASRVVSSIWNVDDRASALLMSRFYDAITTRHLAPAAALRDAQLSMLNDPRWSNPHYWAAFGIQGEWK